MRALGLDPGASFGWAATGLARREGDLELAPLLVSQGTADVGKIIVEAGQWDLSQWRDPGERFCILRRLLESFGKLDVIYYETAPRLQGPALRWGAGYLSHAQAAASFAGARFEHVNAMTLKKWATGSGKADKNDMRSFALQRYRADPELGADAIDALHVLAWGLSR